MTDQSMDSQSQSQFILNTFIDDESCMVNTILIKAKDNPNLRMLLQGYLGLRLEIIEDLKQPNCLANLRVARQ